MRRSLVSSRSSWSDVLLIPGPSRILDWTDDVAANLDRPRHVAREVSRFLFLDRHQLGNRLAPLGNDDRPALLCHLIHQSQTVGLELRCGNVPVVHNRLSAGHPYLTIDAAVAPKGKIAVP